MSVLSISNNNIIVGGKLYCSGDIELVSHSFNMDKNVISYDIILNGNLYLICRKLFILDNIVANCGGVESFNYTDSKILHSDIICVKCPNFEIGGDVMVFYNPSNELRVLKLNKIRNNVYNRQKDKTTYM
jgi:hypothetical protein